MQPNYAYLPTYEKPAVGQAISQPAEPQQQPVQPEVPAEPEKPPTETQAPQDEYQLQQQQNNDAQDLIKQCQAELEELKKAEAAFDEEQAKQSSYGLLRDNALVRSAERPQGKLIYDSEQYQGAEGRMPPMSDQAMQEAMAQVAQGQDPTQVIAQYGDTTNAEAVGAQVGNMYNAPMAADRPF